MNATGDIIHSSDGVGTAAKLTIGTNGQALKVVGGLPAWGAASANLTIRSVTTTDSPTNADDVLLCSGASFTITLFTAVGNTGKVLYIQHAGTSLTQVYTLNTTSGQTIGGVASGAYALYTNGEVLAIYSDGANWLILNHYASTDPVAWTPTISNGFGVATNIAGKWDRKGRMLNGLVSFTSGTVAGNIATLTMPTGAAIDVNYLTLNNASNASGNVVGLWVPNVSNPQRNHALTAPATSTGLIYMGSNATPLVPSNGSTTASSVVFSVNFTVPIIGFQP